MFLAHRVSNLFDDFFRDPFFSTPTWFNETQMMKTDVKDKNGNYLIEIELPGYDKEDIRAELKNGYLTISANRQEENEERDERGNYIRRERYTGSCRRSFYVGDHVRQEDIKAAFRNGVLHLMVPKDVTYIEDKNGYIDIE